MLRVLIASVLSGFISLGYQVAWYRIFTDWFGSTTLTFAVVVCNFIGGLGVGALLSARATRAIGSRLRQPDALRVYGVIEVGVGLAALLTVLLGFLPGDLLGTFPFVFDGTIWVPSANYQFWQVLIGATCVFVPCVFMGMTYPLLCNAFVNEAGGARFPARLYAWNTVGACLGILACQFIFLLWLGHAPTFRLMLLANLALGIYFLVTGGAPTSAALPPPRAATTAGALTSGNYGTLLVLAALSGLTAGALEGDLFKRVSFLIGAAPGATMTFVSFWAVLGIFLASATVHRARWLKFWHVQAAFMIAVAWYYLAWQFRYEIVVGMESGSPVNFPSSLGTLFLFAGVFAFVPYFLVSLLLPYVCNTLQAGRRHLGVAYGVNTLAFCAGLVALGLVAPGINIFYSLSLCLALLALGSAFLIAVRSPATRVYWQVPVFAVLAGGIAVLTPRGFDRNAFYPNEPPRIRPVTAVMANPANTTYVLDMGEPGLQLYFNSHSMSSTSLSAQKYMRLMAHVPLLMQDEPREALLICFGVGNTASAIATHTGLTHIDAVDLNRNVFLTAPVFGRYSNNVHLDPRLRLINDDGRGFLRKTTKTYDLITSEPPPPMAAGVYRLYSMEYYETALAHLTPDGMMTQWLPIYQLPQEAADLMIRTFVQAFPEALLFSGAGEELILVGSRQPLSMETAIAHMDDDPAVTADLARIDVDRPNDLRLRVIAEDGELDRLYGTGPVLRDQHNDLEHLLVNPANRAVYGRVAPP